MLRRFFRVRTACTLAAVAAAFALGALSVDVASATERAASPFRNLTIFARALSHIETSYVEPVDHDRLIYGAIRGMVATLDPHSSFMDPEEYRIQEADMLGRFGGIGIEVDVVNDWLTVVAPIEGGPAARSGVLAGDQIVAIDGRSARSLPIDDAVRMMRGEPGTRVRVRLRREAANGGEARFFDLDLVREVIRVDSIEARLLPDGIIYVEMRSFQETTVDELRAALDRLVDEASGRGGVHGLLIDLRNNPGGLLDQSVLVADEFLRDGVIVSTRGQHGRLLDEARAVPGGTRPNWPMLVLVNEYTASAAEILAGALQDHHRAVIAGQRTFGKGSVQTVIDLPDGSALKITIARYYTPSGHSVQGRGVVPDVVIEQVDQTALDHSHGHEEEPMREADLDAHLHGEDEPEPDAGTPAATSREEPRTTGGAEPGEAFADDFQLRTAYQTLRAILASR